MNAIEAMEKAHEEMREALGMTGFCRQALPNMLDAALQSMQGEAVAYADALDLSDAQGTFLVARFQHITEMRANGTKPRFDTPLYTHPQSPAVPEGYVLVPVAEIKTVAGRMEMIRGASQFCDCSSFDIASSWMNETHGGDLLTASGKGE